MTVFTIFPAVDLRYGAVVRLEQGDPKRQTRYSEDPAATARAWFSAGAPWLHVVNLDGAFGDLDSQNWTAIQAILAEAQYYEAKVQLGGGIRSFQDIRAAFEAGVQRLVLGTLAVEQPEILQKAIDDYGPDRIAAGMDAEAGLVKVRGWQQATRLPVKDLAGRLASAGLKWLIYTDISRDGMGAGLNIQITSQLAQIPGLKVIASGGVRDLRDIEQARQSNCAGVIVGRALYDQNLSINRWEIT